MMTHKRLRTTKTSTPTLKPAAAERRVYNKQTILVVAHEAPIRNGIAAQLETNYDVLLAKDGLDAVYIYEGDAAGIVAIITDFEMPRLNGESMADWIHHISPDLPIIVMSDDRRSAFVKDQSLRFLKKPFQPSQLKSLLSEVLEALWNDAA